MSTDYDQSPLASALGVVLDQDNAKTELEKKRVIAATMSDADKANTDATVARETLYEMIQKGAQAIDNLIDVARESMSARHYEVLAALMNNQSHYADLLLKIQSDKQKVANNAINLERNRLQSANTPLSQGGNTNVLIQNAVFTGTTTELLELIKSANPTALLDQDAAEED